MKLVQYNKNRSNGNMEYIGPFVDDKMHISHVYEGKLDLIFRAEGGSILLFAKKQDIEMFQEDKNDIIFYTQFLKENYTNNGYSLAHTLITHANGLFIDELKSIVSQYPSDEYVLLPMVNYGQFLTYCDFEEGRDFTVEKENLDTSGTIKITFFNMEMKEQFCYELEDAFGIDELLKEIGALKRSEEVYCVHHADGLGYATRDKDTLKHISGYIYKNFLIEE